MVSDPSVAAYLVGFSAVYLVAVVVILGFASRWRRRLLEARDRSRTESVRRLVQLNTAAADVHDALAFQRRSNQESRARIRRAEEAAAENAEATRRNARALEESREHRKRLLSEHAAAVDLVGRHAGNIAGAADRARRASLDRAEAGARALRALERDIEALQKGAVTPGQVREEVAALERSLAEHREAAAASADGFRSTVDRLLAASEAAQRETNEEIAAMYATREEVQRQASELLSAVERAEEQLAAQYSAAEAAAGETAQLCDGAAAVQGADLGAVVSAYEDAVERLGEYSERLEANDAALAPLEERVAGLEAGEAARGEEVAAALADLNSYIAGSCVGRDDLAYVTEVAEAAGEAAAALEARAEDAGLACDGSRRACEEAAGDGVLAEGGSVEVPGMGVLKLEDGRLLMCDLDDACAPLAREPPQSPDPPPVPQEVPAA